MKTGVENPQYARSKTGVENPRMQGCLMKIEEENLRCAPA